MTDDVDFINEVSLIDVLDTVLVEEDRKKYGGVREYNPIRPSSAGKCERALAYEFDEFYHKKPANSEAKQPNVIRLLSIGHYIESSIISHFRKLREIFGISIRYKDHMVTVARLKDGTIIQGEVDYALEGPNFKMLCDAKSAKDKFSRSFGTHWDELTAKWSKNKYIQTVSETCFLITDTYKFVQSLKDDFKIDNIKQLNMYLGSEWFQERGYEYGSLHYYVKNDSRMYELRFKFCPKLQKEVIKKYQSAYDNGQKNPDKANKSFHFGSIRCAWCPYKERCWTEETDPKYAYFQTLPKKTWPKDLDRVKDAKKLEKLFDNYEKCLTESEEAGSLELEIAQALYDQKVSKVKLASGDVWEVKLLKSKGLVLRRSKM